ncbi:MAG: hypothetical protein U1E47_05950 [Rivihabitans pingtungensis]
MNRMLSIGVCALLLTASLTGCADMNKRQRNTAIGAAVGGVAGSVLTGGSSGGHRGWRGGGRHDWQPGRQRQEK